MKYIPLFLLLIGVAVSGNAAAQYASQMDAAYLATIKAVADYKINDEENLKQVNELRENEQFNKKLAKMLEQLNNKRTKTGKNRQVYQILQRAGKEIYDILK